MALSNSQYDAIMRTYESRQYENERKLRQRYDEIYRLIPAIKELDDKVSSLSIAKAKAMVSGQDSALGQFKEELSLLFVQKKELLKSFGYPEDYLETHYTCPDCKDTGYIGTEKCHCFKHAIVNILYKQSNLKELLDEENFSKLSMEYYSNNHKDPLTGRSSLESMQTALQTCVEFVENFSKSFDNILLYGDTGVGKSFLSHCIAKELMDSSYSVIYFSATQFFDFLAKNTFGRKDDADQDALDHIYSCDLLIIDDLGTEFTNAFTSSQLFACLNERILRQKSTIISTNLSLDDIKSIYSERIFSRISSNYIMLRLTGDDIRIQKKLLSLGGTRNATP